MKQLIVLCSTIVLGIFIYGLIMGDGDSSVISTMSSVWEANVEARKLIP